MRNGDPPSSMTGPITRSGKIHEDVGRYDRLGIELFAAGAGNRILRNKLDRVFDGVTIGDYRCENLDKFRLRGAALVISACTPSSSVSITTSRGGASREKRSVSSRSTAKRIG